MYNAQGSLAACAHVPVRMQPGTVWVRNGWPGLNQLTAAAAVLPDPAVDVFAFSAGQSSFGAKVEVALQDPETGPPVSDASAAAATG